jgi:uncharacterized protein
MDSNDLFAALALVLIIEGIMPFASPAALRRVCALMAQMADGPLRTGGFVSMVVGAVALYFIRR